MDRLDEAALKEALSAYGVLTTQPAALYFSDPRHPANSLFGLASNLSAQPLELLVAEHGTPEHFFLSGLPFTPVVLSLRYLGLTAKLQSLVVSDKVRGETRRNMAEGLALNTIAEFCLLEGMVEHAAFAFMKSRVVGGNFLLPDWRQDYGPEGDLLGIYMQDLDEDWVAGHTFGFAHELGHAIQAFPKMNAALPPWCDDATIQHRLEYAAQNAHGDAGELFRKFGPTASLQVERLRSEAGADIQACRLVAKVAQMVVAEHCGGRDIDLARLVMSIAYNYVTINFVSSCRRAAAFTTLGPGDEERIIDLGMQPLAFGTRQLLVRDHIPILILELSARGISSTPLTKIVFDGFTDEEIQEVRTAYIDLWDSAIQQIYGVYDDVEQGRIAAIRCFTPAVATEEATAQIVGEYWTRVRQNGEEPDWPTNWFVDLAHALGLPGDRAERLAGILKVERST